MRFSICVPTRGRINNVNRLTKSIYDKATKPNTIEIIYRVDDDDRASQEAIPKLIAENVRRKFAPIKMVIGKRTKYLSDLWEDCYPLTSGQRIMMCADDVIFRTQSWDDKIFLKTPDAHQKLYFIWGNDLNQCRGLATLPMMSRPWVENVGYFVPRGYACDWCDTHLHDIANKLANCGTNVRCYFRDVIFEHMHPTIGKAKWDPTYHHRRSMGSSSGTYSTTNKARNDIAKRIHALVLAGKVKAGKHDG